jgi:hypothetical protein
VALDPSRFPDQDLSDSFVAFVPFVVAALSNRIERMGSTQFSPLILLILCILSWDSAGRLSGFG